MVLGLGKSKSKQQQAQEDDGFIPDPYDGQSWSNQGLGLPAYTQSPEGPEHQFHVYRAKAWNSLKEDTIITSASKDRVLYYLHLPADWLSSWRNVALHEGYKGGPVVAGYSKGNWLKQSHIKIQHYPVRGGPPTEIALNNTRMLSNDHIFTIPGTSIDLKWDINTMQTRMRLVDSKTKEQAALFEFAGFAKRKLGKLLISPEWLDHLELILLTAVAMERYVYMKQVEAVTVTTIV